jgi:hypothetical protein
MRPRPGVSLLGVKREDTGMAETQIEWTDATWNPVAGCSIVSASRLVTGFGDAVGVGQFYSSIYNMTPAHMDDIHAAMIENPDLEIVTEAGGERRKPNTIRPDDTLRMKKQRTMFPIFLNSNKEQ